jgi:hypothetical protein
MYLAGEKESPCFLELRVPTSLDVKQTTSHPANSNVMHTISEMSPTPSHIRPSPSRGEPPHHLTTADRAHLRPAAVTFVPPQKGR